MSKQSHEEKLERDTTEWDAEIEAEFQRVTQQAKAGGRARRRSRHIGCPVAFMAEVCRLTKGRTALIVAQCIYRRTKVCKARTVTLPADDLADLGIPRRRKLEALVRLCAAGLIKVETAAAGRTGMITLLWEEG